jgi:hypothetical protein
MNTHSIPTACVFCTCRNYIMPQHDISICCSHPDAEDYTKDRSLMEVDIREERPAWCPWAKIAEESQ